MAVVVRSPEAAEIDELFQRVYDRNKSVVYMPIRHHSPACSYHVQQIIRTYEPEAILIEGPANCTALIPQLISEGTEAPISMYCSYDDKQGVLTNGEAGKYRAYYPLLNYSPELVALQEGAVRDIPTRFIDLPYQEYLVATKQEQPQRLEEAYFRHSQYARGLADKTGCRSFHEFWEKYFELQGRQLSTEEFIRQLFVYCYYTRADYTEEMLKEDGCLQREIYMEREIQKAKKLYKRILVVTGGFHVSGLLALEGTKEKIGKGPLSATHTKQYIMPYSFFESDQAEGYESGMPAPFFYQQLWEGEEKAAEQLVLRVARHLRQDGVSIADEMEAIRMVRELTMLREKQQAGLYEVTDAVQSTFIKGEASEHDRVLTTLHAALQGTKRGKLSTQAEVPPLVQDFRAQATSFRMPVRSTVPQEVTLDVHKKEKHLRMSHFFHRLSFLDVPFCERLRGPNVAKRQHVHLMREVWRYRFSAQVESALIDVSVYGATIEEAAQEMLQARLREASGRASELALLLLEGFWSGLFQDVMPYEALIEEAIHEDADFVSMVDGAYYLSQMNEMHRLTHHAWQRALQLFTVLSGGEAAKIGEKLTVLYAMQPANEQFTEALELYMQRHIRECEVEGTVLGLLASLEKRSLAEVLQVAEGYFYGSGDMQKRAPFFLAGLMRGAKGLFLYNEQLLSGLSHVLAVLSEEEFLTVLPQLRLLFGQLTPREVQTVAAAVARLYRTDEQTMREETIAEHVLQYAYTLNEAAENELRKRGLEDGE